MYEKERHLCLRSLSEDTFQLLNGTNGAVLPFFSPDEKWLGFVTEQKVKKIEISSGLLTDVCDAKNPYAGATCCAGVWILCITNIRQQPARYFDFLDFLFGHKAQPLFIRTKKRKHRPVGAI